MTRNAFCLLRPVAMKPILRLMSQVLALACIPSAFFFALWTISAMQDLAGIGVGRLFPFQAQNPLLWKLIVIWWLAAGLCGWVSLLLLYRNSDRHLSRIPKRLLVGLGIGIAAALSFPPFPSKHAYAPVGLALLLLFIARTNPPPTEATRKLSPDKG